MITNCPHCAKEIQQKKEENLYSENPQFIIKMNKKLDKMAGDFLSAYFKALLFFFFFK